jgi:glycosyltransferase involved in cell wall biosynthesis
MPDEQPTPVFSIITVTFNAEKVIEKTIRSVIEQEEEYPHLEFIIVDGASKDGTMAIVERYKAHITKVVSEPDKGLYDAMNKGIAMATGDYLCFINAGDRFHETHTLREVAGTLPKGDLPGVIYGETAIVDSEGHFLHLRRLRAPEHLTWRSFRKGMVVCHQSFYPLRSLTPTYDLNYRYSADVDWCIRVMKAAKVLHNTRLILVDYISEGMSTKNRRASLWERFHIMEHHYGLPVTVMQHIIFVFRLLFLRSQ